ncbi:MAG TPA: hypothetical protein VGI03_09005 [Verrucomicrobiae bacterium]|jgi:hypothetical protein
MKHFKAIAALSLAELFLLIFTGLVSAQNTLNITNYGAMGDAVQFFVNTTSNSTLVTTSNALPRSAIGETMEVFGAGTPTTSSNNQDLVTSISSISDGTNITLSTACRQTLTPAFATCGHNNSPNFMSAIAAVGSDSHDVINIPAGNFLFIATNYPGAYGDCSILLQRAGISIVGAGAHLTKLLSQGAWQRVRGHAVRGFLVELASPMTKPQFPISFSDLTLDGGVQQGNTPWHFFPASVITGAGWDETHDAVLAWVANGGSLPQINYTNDVIQHWRGEEFKSIDQPANSRIGIYGCTFTDGNATALNVYPAWNVVSNTFDNLFQVAEFYQQYASYPGLFAWNLITNISYNGFAINGATGTNAPFTIASNVFYLSANGANEIETMPAANLSVIGNQFWLSGSGQTVFSIGTLGYQGTFCNSNILISGNFVSNCALFCAFGGGSPNNTVGLTVCSNSVIPQFATAYACKTYGTATNVHFCGNNFTRGYTPWQSGMDYLGKRVGQFALVDSNNIYSPYCFSGYCRLAGNTTNVVSYAFGPDYTTAGLTQTNVTFALEDSSSNQIPPGAYISFDNSQNTNEGYDVFYSQTMSTGFMRVAPGQHVAFYWNNLKDTWELH